MIHQITDRERELTIERNEYKAAADKMAAEHKVERDALAAENERLKEAIVGWKADQKENLKNQCDLHMENTKLREAARMGLEAFTWKFDGRISTAEKMHQAITALKEALGEME